MPSNKLISLAEAVRRHTWDGMQYASGAALPVGSDAIASGAGRVVVMVTHEAKRFANKVSYISSPGYLEGGNARERYGFVGKGPSAIITTLGILRPDPVSKEFILEAYYAFSSIAEILANTGWDLKVFADGSCRARADGRRTGRPAPGRCDGCAT
jgi:hypothetical protein